MLFIKSNTCGHPLYFSSDEKKFNRSAHSYPLARQVKILGADLKDRCLRKKMQHPKTQTGKIVPEGINLVIVLVKLEVLNYLIIFFLSVIKRTRAIGSTGCLNREQRSIFPGLQTQSYFLCERERSSQYSNSPVPELSFLPAPYRG